MIKTARRLSDWFRPSPATSTSAPSVAEPERFPAPADPVGEPQSYSVQQLNRYGQNCNIGMLPTYGASADYHFQSDADYYTIVEICRQYDRNNPLVGQMVNRLVANVLQDGFSVNPQTGDEELDKYLADRWEQFATDPNRVDVAGELTWKDLERMVFRAQVVDGDCAVLGTDFGFQVFEAHNIAKHDISEEDNIWLGVELNDVRRRIAYWFSSTRFDRYEESMPAAESRRYETLVQDPDGNPMLFPGGHFVRQVMHVIDPNRTTLTRGVSNLYPYITPLGLIQDIDEATLVSLQTGTCFVVFRQQPLDPGAELMPEGENTRKVQTPSGVREIKDLVPGTEVIGNPGEQFNAFSPTVPTANYLDFRLQQIASIAAGLDLALEGVTLDFREANFVGFRGAEHEAKKGQRRRQENLKQRLHKPAYAFQVSRWLEADTRLQQAAADGIDIFRHDWTLPKVDYVEPVNDAKGDVIRAQNSLTSRRRISGERGEKWSEVRVEIVDDNYEALDYAAERTMELNAKYPDLPVPISVHNMLPLPTADGVQQNATIQVPAEPAAPGNSEGTSDA